MEGEPREGGRYSPSPCGRGLGGGGRAVRVAPPPPNPLPQGEGGSLMGWLPVLTPQPTMVIRPAACRANTAGPVHVGHLRPRQFERPWRHRPHPDGQPEVRLVRVSATTAAYRSSARRLCLGVRQLAQPGHPRHVAAAKLAGDLPARRQPVLHHGAVRLAVLGLALQHEHEHRVLLQVIQVERLAVQCLELPGDPHLRPGRRQAASPERRSPTPPATPPVPPGCARSSARSSATDTVGRRRQVFAIHRDVRRARRCGSAPRRPRRPTTAPGWTECRATDRRPASPRSACPADRPGRPLSFSNNGDRRLIAQRGAVVECPPFAGPARPVRQRTPPRRAAGRGPARAPRRAAPWPAASAAR